MLDPAAVEQIDQLRAQLRELAVGRLLYRSRPRHRRAARLELELHAAVRRHVSWGPAQPICVLGLERRERRVVGALQSQLRVGQAEGPEVPSLTTSAPSAKWPVHCSSAGRADRRRARAVRRAAASAGAGSAWSAWAGRDHPIERRGVSGSESIVHAHPVGLLLLGVVVQLLPDPLPPGVPHPQNPQAR